MKQPSKLMKQPCELIKQPSELKKQRSELLHDRPILRSLPVQSWTDLLLACCRGAGVTHHSIMSYQERLISYMSTLARAPPTSQLARVSLHQEAASANMTSLFSPTAPGSDHRSAGPALDLAALDTMGRALGEAAQVPSLCCCRVVARLQLTVYHEAFVQTYPRLRSYLIFGAVTWGVRQTQACCILSTASSKAWTYNFENL